MRIKLLALLCIASSLSSCSVYMAATPSEPVDLSVLKVGASKSDIDIALGNPTAPLRKDTPTDVVSYQYFTGDEASIPRAVVYGVVDVATLGLSELVFTRVEALQGDKHIVECSYDKFSKLKNYNLYFLKAPMENPEKTIGVDDIGVRMPTLGLSRPAERPTRPSLPPIYRASNAPTPRTPPTQAKSNEMVQF